MTVVDASVWVSWFLTRDANHAPSRRWMERYIADGGQTIEPAHILPELSGAISRQTGLGHLGGEAILRVLQIPRLRLITVDVSLARSAAELASSLKLRGADSLYVATARRFGVPLVTWDREQRERTTAVIVAHTPDQMS